MVTDNTGNEAEHGQSFNVSAPGDETGPCVQIHGPSMGDSPTASQDVVVTVQDPNLGEWILEVGKSDSECFTPIAWGRGELVEELAGHLDTTLMPTHAQRHARPASDRLRRQPTKTSTH